MIRGKLIHPEILAALASAGHGSTVLISDGNFPHATAPSIEAPRVFLNLSPGLLTVSQVLDVLVEAIPIERAALMIPQEPGAPTPDAHADLLGRLPAGVEVDRILRMDFYPATDTENLALVIATGDLRLYANVLLTIGVIEAEA
jgi:L-fucose mutarotase